MTTSTMKKLEIVLRDMLDDAYKTGFKRGALYGVLITVLSYHLFILPSLRLQNKATLTTD